MLGQFTRQDQSHGRLDFSARHGRLLVVSRQFRGFSRDLFEDVVDEGVHDAHRLGGDAGVRVHLLQDLVDVDLVGFDLLLGGLLGAAFDGLLCWFLAGHFCCVCVYVSVNNGVCIGGEWSEAFENLNVESSDFSTITKSVEKKQNRMDRSFFYARSIGAQNVTRGSNWCNE